MIQEFAVEHSIKQSLDGMNLGFRKGQQVLSCPVQSYSNPVKSLLKNCHVQEEAEREELFKLIEIGTSMVVHFFNLGGMFKWRVSNRQWVIRGPVIHQASAIMIPI